MSHNNYMKKILIILLIFITISSYRLLSLKDKHTYQKGYIYGLTAPRGRILDRNGKILVNNIGVKSLVFNKLSISTKETNGNIPHQSPPAHPLLRPPHRAP